MTRQMLKEEKVFRARVLELCRWAEMAPQSYMREITALVRAVREDCAKVAADASNGSPNMNYKSGCADAAAAIRRKK